MTFSNRTFFAISSSVVALALLIVGGVYAYLRTLPGKATVTPSPEGACTLDAKLCPDGSAVGRIPPACEFAPCPSASSNLTSGWKVYRSTAYHYEVKYPPTWTLEVSDNEGKDVHLRNNTDRERVTQAMEIQVHNNSENEGGDPFLQLKGKHYLEPEGLDGGGTLTHFTLNGKRAIKVQYGGGESIGFEGPGYYIEKDANSFFYVFVSSRRPVHFSTAEKILGTLVSLGTDSNRNTYQSDQYGFEIQHPSYLTKYDSDSGLLTYQSYLVEHEKIVTIISFQLQTGDLPIPDPLNVAGTNLSQASLAIAVSKTGVTTQKCERYAEDHAHTSLMTQKRTAGGNVFNYAEITGAAAGTFHTTHIYHIAHNSRCYELNANVFVSNIENYEPGTVRAVDEKKVWEALESVVETFRFLR